MVIEQEAPEIVDIPINMGPQHPSTHGVFRMVLVISGDHSPAFETLCPQRPIAFATSPKSGFFRSV